MKNVSENFIVSHFSSSEFYHNFTSDEIEFIELYCEKLEYKCEVRDDLIKVENPESKLWGYLQKERKTGDIMYGFLEKGIFIKKHNINGELRLFKNIINCTFGSPEFSRMLITKDWFLKGFCGIVDLLPQR